MGQRRRNTDGWPSRARSPPRSLAAVLNRLRAQLKLPERLSACGVEGKELTAALDGLAEAAQADLCAPSNPRPAAAEDLKSLLRELA